MQMLRRENLNKGIIFTVFVAIMCAAAGFNLSASGQNELPVFAYQDRVGDAAAIIAAEKMKSSGVFDTKRFSSGGLCAEALISGTADAATMGDAVAVKLAARYPENIIFLGVHGEGAQRHRLVRSKRIPDKIAVKFGTSTHAALLAWYENQGIDLNSEGAPELVDMPPSLQISALSSGEVDAIAASEPTPSIALEKICGEDCSLEAVTLDSPGRKYPIVLVTTRKSLSKFGDQIKNLENELNISAELIDSNMDLLSGITGLDFELLEKSLSYHDFGLKPVQQYQDELDELAGFLLERGAIPEKPDWSAVMDINKN